MAEIKLMVRNSWNNGRGLHRVTILVQGVGSEEEAIKAYKDSSIYPFTVSWGTHEARRVEDGWEVVHSWDSGD